MAKKSSNTPTHPRATTPEVEKIHALLGEYRDRTVRKHFIGELLGITDERVIRDGISQIVLRGLGAVVPDRVGGGYRLTEDLDEIRVEIAHLRAYGRRIRDRINALKKIIKRIEAATAEVFSNEPEAA